MGIVTDAVLQNANVSATARLTVTAAAFGRLRNTGIDRLDPRPSESVSRPNEITGGTAFVIVITAGADDTVPLVATTLSVPIATPVTMPLELTVARAFVAAHVNVPPEMNWLLESLPRAVSPTLPSGATLAVAGVITTDVSTCCTVSAAAPVMP